MEIVKPRWSSWSFLVYAGGLTVLAAASDFLSFLSGRYGDAAYAAWALLVLAALVAIAVSLRRTGHPVAAGVFAFGSVFAFGGFLTALWAWFGWASPGAASSPFSGFHVGGLLLELLVLAAAVKALRTFRFPLISLAVTGSAYFFFVDLVSNGGNWSAVVSIVAGLVLLGVGVGLDGGASRPYGFWVHIVAGLAIGGSLIYFWHHGTTYWALVAVASVAYIWLAGPTGRSSWAVIGTFGLLAAATYFAVEWTHASISLLGISGSQRDWVPPLVFAVTGAMLLALGFRNARR